MILLKRFLALIFSAAAAVAISCNQGTSSNTADDSTYAGGELQALETKGLASKSVIDSVFLGFKFGMTTSQTRSHLEKLHSNGKLLTDDGRYYFPIDSKVGGVYKGFVFPTYFKNKLVAIGLLFKDEPNPIIVFSQLAELYESKYGTYDIIRKPIADVSVYEKIWVRDNLKILIQSGITAATVEYIDLRFEQERKAADSVNTAEKENKLKEGI